jgi:hypothetical protein
MTVDRETSQQERLGTIELYRTNHGWVDRNEAFRVRVDDTERGSVYPYQHVDFQVAEGRHEVAISLDDLRPKSIQVEVAAGERTLLICSSRPGFSWFNPLLLGNWVRLNIQESPRSGTMKTT